MPAMTLETVPRQIFFESFPDREKPDSGPGCAQSSLCPVDCEWLA